MDKGDRVGYGKERGRRGTKGRFIKTGDDA